MEGLGSISQEDQVLIAHQPALEDRAQVKVHQKKELFSNILPKLIPLNLGKIHSVVKWLVSLETAKSDVDRQKLTGDKKIWKLWRVTKSHFK